MIVVDLERHNDGEGGLVGPFDSRQAAEEYIALLSDDFARRWATIRTVSAAGGDRNHD